MIINQRWREKYQLGQPPTVTCLDVFSIFILYITVVYNSPVAKLDDYLLTEKFGARPTNGNGSFLLVETRHDKNGQYVCTAIHVFAGA